MNLFEAKRKYRSLYKIEFKDGRDKTVIVFRGLNWAEFKSYRDLLGGYQSLEQQAYEDIFKQCVVDSTLPHDIDEDGLLEFEIEEMPAGIIDSLGSAIYKMSGAASTDQLWNDLSERRDWALNDIEKRMLSAVCAITKYKLEDFDKLYWYEILDVIAQSEQLMIGNYPEAPFMPFVPEEVKKIDFNSENRDDNGGSEKNEDIIERRRQQTRDRKKQAGLR